MAENTVTVSTRGTVANTTSDGLNPIDNHTSTMTRTVAIIRSVNSPFTLSLALLP
jgi:hypothetical protein